MAPVEAWQEVEEAATVSQQSVLANIQFPTHSLLPAVLGEVEELGAPANPGTLDLSSSSKLAHPPSTSSIHHSAPGGKATLPEEMATTTPAPPSLATGLARRRSRLKLQL